MSNFILRITEAQCGACLRFQRFVRVNGVERDLAHGVRPWHVYGGGATGDVLAFECACGNKAQVPLNHHEPRQS